VTRRVLQQNSPSTTVFACATIGKVMLSHSKNRRLAQLKGVPVQAGTHFFNLKNHMQPFDFIDVFYFGTTMHNIIRL